MQKPSITSLRNSMRLEIFIIFPFCRTRLKDWFGLAKILLNPLELELTAVLRDGRCLGHWRYILRMKTTIDSLKVLTRLMRGYEFIDYEWRVNYDIQLVNNLILFNSIAIIILSFIVGVIHIIIIVVNAFVIQFKLTVIEVLMNESLSNYSVVAIYHVQD